MVDLDMERAKKLLESAEHLYHKGDLAGVAGLSYQHLNQLLYPSPEKLMEKIIPAIS